MVADDGWTVDSSLLPDGRDMRRYLVAALAGALPCLAAAAWYLGLRIMVTACAAVLSMAAVEVVFGIVRKRPIGGGALVFGILLALMLPPTTPIWMVAVGAAFGALFGKEIFGGTGHHVFNPVLVGKAFLVFSYPAVVKGYYVGSMLEFEQAGAWQVCAGLLLLGGLAVCIARPSNLLVVVGILVSATVTGSAIAALGRMPFTVPSEMLITNGFLFGACFLASDPATCPGTRMGKLLYGLIIGVVAATVRCLSNYEEGMMSAILVANVFTPTINAMSVSRSSTGVSPVAPGAAGKTHAVGPEATAGRVPAPHDA